MTKERIVINSQQAEAICSPSILFNLYEEIILTVGLNLSAAVQVLLSFSKRKADLHKFATNGSPIVNCCLAQVFTPLEDHSSLPVQLSWSCLFQEGRDEEAAGFSNFDNGC